MELEEHSAYKNSFTLSNYVWNIVSKWPNFAKFSLGKQYVEAIDSISANIAEGWHRYFKKDKKQFYIIARASAGESIDWTKKAKLRGLLKEKEYKYIFQTLEELPKEINGLIKSTLNNLKK